MTRPITRPFPDTVLTITLALPPDLARAIARWSALLGLAPEVFARGCLRGELRALDDAARAVGVEGEGVAP